MPTNEDSLIRDYMAVADDVFARVKPTFSPESEARLAAMFTLPEGLYADLVEACHAYVSGTLAAHGIKGDHDDPYLNLRDHNEEITNLTINGALNPKDRTGTRVQRDSASPCRHSRAL